MNTACFCDFKAFLAVALVTFLSGCTLASFSRLGPQSCFVYPNSNVKALGPAHASAATDPSLVPQGLRESKMDRKLYTQALNSVEGANVITDYVVTARMKVIPLIYINLYWTQYELDGTAAKMEVGKQVLH